MKLGKIGHVRCGEHTFCTTLVWVPDDWDEEVFEDAVGKAQDAYLENLKTWKERNPPPSHSHMPDYAAYPDKTVAEVQARHEDSQAVWKDYREQERLARRTFGEYLAEQGMTLIWKGDFGFKTEVDWGHRHGEEIDYSEFEDEDLPGPLRYQRL